MPSSNYTVASSKQLLGAKPPKHAPRPEDTYFDNLDGRETSTDNATTDKMRKKNPSSQDKSVRFARPAASPNTRSTNSSSMDTTTTTSTPTTHKDDTDAASLVDSVLSTHTSNSHSRPKRPHASPPLAYLQHHQNKKRQIQPIRSKEFLAERTLPPAHAWRLQQQHQNVSRPRTGSQPSDVYFPPLDVEGFITGFSEPLSPSGSGVVRGGNLSESAGRLVLNGRQLDRLVSAFVDSRLLKEGVGRRWWERGGPPATTFSPQAQQKSKNQTQLSCHPNALITGNGSRALAPSPLPEPELMGTALADPNIHGAPIHSYSPGYKLGSNTVRVGACTFLNLPYGSSSSGNLRIEPPSRNSKMNHTQSKETTGCRITYQNATALLDRQTKRQVWLLVNEYEITASVTQAALSELQNRLGADAIIEVSNPTSEHQAPREEEEIDWTHLASSAQKSYALTDQLELVASSFKHLNASTCAPETRALLSQLEGLRRRHQKTLILRPVGLYDSLVDRPGQLVRFGKAWGSERFWDDEGEGEGSGDGMGRVLAGVVARRGGEGERGFEVEIEGGRVGVVPLVEGDEGREVVGWVCTF